VQRFNEVCRVGSAWAHPLSVPFCVSYAINCPACGAPGRGRGRGVGGRGVLKVISGQLSVVSCLGSRSPGSGSFLRGGTRLVSSVRLPREIICKGAGGRWVMGGGWVWAGVLVPGPRVRGTGGTHFLDFDSFPAQAKLGRGTHFRAELGVRGSPPKRSFDPPHGRRARPWGPRRTGHPDLRLVVSHPFDKERRMDGARRIF
jgi:hypothetical protein